MDGGISLTSDEIKGTRLIDQSELLEALVAVLIIR